MAASWDLFLPGLLVQAPDVPDPVARQALVRAARSFCRRTRAWQEWAACATTPTPGVYTMTLPAESEVVRIERVTVDRQLLKLVPFTSIEHDPITYAADEDAGVVSADMVTLTVTGPAIVGDIKAQLSLMPTSAATGVADPVGSLYRDEIACGAAAELLRMTGASWFNPHAAAGLEARFQQAIGAAGVDTSRSNTSANRSRQVLWC